MATKTAKQLESELQAAQEAAKKIEQNLARAKKIEADRAERAKIAADKKNRKARISRKAELDTILVDFEDVILPNSNARPATQQRSATPRQAPSGTAGSPPAPAATNPAENRDRGFFAGLFNLKKE